MRNEAQRKQALDRIRENIARSGHHVYVVSGGATPRFAYTIGVSESIGIELILAGAIFYMFKDVTQIIDNIAAQLKAHRDQDQESFEITGLGSFTLCKVHSSWATGLMLGAFDYYQRQDIPVLQIVPDEAHWTVDVPDMRVPWSATTAPVWQWLYESWTYPVPEDSTAATDLAALRGERITEAARWEEDEWEICHADAPSVPKEEMRVVPLGTLLGADKSLLPVVSLSIGDGLLRDHDPNSDWRPWRKNEKE
jgi:hypothetical protein